MAVNAPDTSSGAGEVVWSPPDVVIEAVVIAVPIVSGDGFAVWGPLAIVIETAGNVVAIESGDALTVCGLVAVPTECAGTAVPTESESVRPSSTPDPEPAPCVVVAPTERGPGVRFNVVDCVIEADGNAAPTGTGDMVWVVSEVNAGCAVTAREDGCTV